MSRSETAPEDIIKTTFEDTSTNKPVVDKEEMGCYIRRLTGLQSLLEGIATRRNDLFHLVAALEAVKQLLDTNNTKNAKEANPSLPPLHICRSLARVNLHHKTESLQTLVESRKEAGVFRSTEISTASVQKTEKTGKKSGFFACFSASDEVTTETTLIPADERDAAAEKILALADNVKNAFSNQYGTC